MENDSNIIGIYHKNCNDGTTAAAVLLTKFPDAKVYPLDHGYTESDLLPILEKIIPNLKVYTIDCCLGVPEILKVGAFVTTIDHHISVKNEMEAISKKNDHFTFIFDNDKSGASLAWKYFFPNSPTPRLIELVEDCDLWTEKYGNDTKSIAHYLTRFLNDPKKIIPLLINLPQNILDEGASLSLFEELLIQQFLANNNPTKLSIGTHYVPAYNSPFFKSELGSILSERHGSVVCIFNIKGDVVRLSFRSKNEQNPSAKDIAKILGGGGHKNAAGARVTLNEFKKLIIE